MSTQPTKHEPMETPETLSEEVGVPKRTLGQWRYLGTGPAFVKVGRHVRYRRSDIDAWLEAQTRGGTVS